VCTLTTHIPLCLQHNPHPHFFSLHHTTSRLCFAGGCQGATAIKLRKCDTCTRIYTSLTYTHTHTFTCEMCTLVSVTCVYMPLRCKDAPLQRPFTINVPHLNIRNQRNLVPSHPHWSNCSLYMPTHVCTSTCVHTHIHTRMRVIQNPKFPPERTQQTPARILMMQQW